MKGLMAFVPPSNLSLYINTLPNVGMLGIASFIESKGFPVDVIDGNVDEFNPDLEKYDFFCFGVNIANLQNTYKLVDEIKAKYPRKKVILGGPSIQNMAERYAKSCNADAVIVGEGEFPLLEFLQAKTKKSWLTVPGLCIKQKSGKVIFTGPRRLIMHPDELPFPALDKVPIEKYNVPIKQARPISNMVTSRGCPQECIYCFHTRAWRPRGAKHVVDEIEWQVNKLGVKEIAINDDNFTLHEERAAEVCDMIIKRGIKVKLQTMNGIRADKVSKDLLTKMKNAGFWMIAVAPETGSQKTLEIIKKKMSLDQVKQCVEWGKELGLITFGFFMIGFPWENKGDIQKTINYAKNLDCDFAQFTRVTPIEGTELYTMMQKQGTAPEQGAQDEGFFFGSTKHEGFTNIPTEEVGDMVKQAYRMAYLRPRKMWKIARLLDPRDIWELTKYAFVSNSM